MRKFISVFSLMCVAMVLSGCFQNNGILGYKPRPWGLGGPPDNAPENYKKGWHDGCDTGLSEFTGSGYKSFYKFTQDPKLVEDPVYYQVWKSAEQYCKHYPYKWINRADQDMGKTFGPGANPLCVICAPVEKEHGH